MVAFPQMPSAIVVNAATARLADAVAAALPNSRLAMRALIPRITTANWALEWESPSWLGAALGLPSATEAELRFANAAMLAYIRVADDIADGELDAAAAPLAQALRSVWRSAYRPLFGAPPSGGLDTFEAFFDQYEAEWNAATFRQSGSDAPLWADYDETAFRRIAHRGATLKVAVAAAAVLAGREDVIAPIATSVDDVMVGVAMLDDAFDWVADLTAGRYNVFIAFCSDLPQTSAHERANQIATLRRIYGREGVSQYFRRLSERLAHAEKILSAGLCPGLLTFATAYRHEVRNCELWFAEQAGERRRVFAQMQEASP